MKNQYCIINQTNDNVSISESKYKEIKKAKKGLLEALFIEEEFDIALENFYEYEMELVKCSMNYMLFGNYNRFANERNSINRRTMNLLSACKSYIDNGKSHMSKIDKSITQEIGGSESEEQELLHYQIIKCLRNYAQHEGLPIQDIKYNSEQVNQDKLKISITPYIDIQKINSSRSCKVKDLNNLNKKYDIKPLLRDYISSIFKIHQKTRDLLKNHKRQWDQLFRSKIEEFKSNSNAIGLAAVICKGNDYTNPVYIFPDIIERRIDLEKKNRELTLLKSRYVSSE